MDNRFSNMMGLSEEDAIAFLDTPLDQVRDGNARYTAAAHLVNFSSERSIQALIRAVNNTDPSLDNRIVRRKAVESLGRLKVPKSLPVIQNCLKEEDDCYTVENAVWAIGEIGTDDPKILEEIAELLTKPKQTYRVIIQTLAKLHYPPAIERIQAYTDHEEGPIASAAIAAVARLSHDEQIMAKILPFLENSNVYTRRLCIQDLMDAHYYQSIAAIARCPVSLIFRIRGIRTLLAKGLEEKTLTFQDVQADLENVLRDHPDTINLIHEYDQAPVLEFLIRELYETDFGRCYLATQTLIQENHALAPELLIQNYRGDAYNDYGANYHVVKVLGWLKHAPAYDIFIEALHRTEPQFQKSRTAAAIALGELGDTQAIPELHRCLSTSIWDLKYAALMSLEQLGEDNTRNLASQDADWLVQQRATLRP